MAIPKQARTKFLEAQTEQGKKQLLKITADARREIELKILEAAERGDFIRAAAIRDKLYSGIAEEYVRLNKGVDDWTKRRSEVVAKSWHTMAIDDLPKGAAGITFGKFSEKYLNDIVGKINPATVDKRVALNPHIEGMLAEDVRAIRTAVADTIRKGALTGMTNPELSAEMQRRAAQIKPSFQFVDKAGRTWKSDSYFAMLNRTLHATVARETYQDTAVESGYDLFTIDGGPSAGPPDDPCHDWYGEVISLTGQTKGYKTYQDALDAGVFHPNCTHVLGVYVEGLKEAMVKRNVKDE